MCSQCAASLILEVLSGELYENRGTFQRTPTEYMRNLLYHVSWGGDTSFGNGVPPGTVILNKIGGEKDCLYWWRISRS